MRTTFIYTALFFILNLSLVNAQKVACDCKAELDFYYQESQNLISFKDQFNKKDKLAYQNLFHNLKSEISGSESSIECLQIISQLAAQIKDEHASLRMKGFDIEKSQKLTDPENLKLLKASLYFKSLPRLDVNIDSLKTFAQAVDQSSAQGVYSNQIVTVAVTEIDAGSYQAIVLDSESPVWEKGMVYAYFDRIEANRYQLILAHPDHKVWYALRNEVFENGRFFISNFKKLETPDHFDQVGSDAATFSYEKLDSETGYLRLGSFSRMSDNVSESRALYDEVKGKIDSENLIVDLRNNIGGADKVAKPWKKLIRKFAKKNQVFVLLNKNSASNAEITADYLTKFDNVTLLGRDSWGACAYGSNYGNAAVSASGLFYFMKTDMDYSYLLEYEERGISVDIELDLKRDWITQTQEFIKSKSRNYDLVAQ
ncbi:hypothetical protein BST97_04535 [Nonlabens spongiae]|uniref:Tail specific protease domain-containing protein n=1 Tax=Nonlabens spongiae TaxID=331648 RepID=A0A1W6MIB2_9FLAO|nr:S41 family peptidase [Nonlabens spongiae]ARN77307.1 hypothetical protein BST97_04535 [Nonlabens spongiae]